MIKIANKICAVITPYVVRYYETRAKRKLKNKNFTILCSNCIGGTIYNRLGLQFLSPTVNMWETQRDFIKLAVNLKYYMNQPLVFIQTDEKTPVARCGDIILHFNHHKNAYEAEKDWERRKKRINYNNLYVIFYFRDGYSLEEICEIEKVKCKNIALLTSKELPLDYAITLKPNFGRPNADSFLDRDIFGIRTFEKQWDYVGWLNEARMESNGI